MKKTTFLLLALFFLISLPSLSAAQGTHRAALVVQTATGTVITKCVPFTEASISGYELLVRSGLPLIVDAGGVGTAVCSINDTGCPSSNCFCACSGSECVYWSYWHRVSDVWVYSSGGASASMIADGAVEGWVWGPGSVTDAVPPPTYSFDSICNAPATVTPSPTATPVTPESTPITISTPLPTSIAPTSTSTPTAATAVPTSQPTPTATGAASIFTTPTATPTARPANDDSADNGNSGGGTAVDTPTTVPILPTNTPQASSPLSPPPDSGEDSLTPSPTTVTPPTPTLPVIKKTEPITAVSEITAVDNPTPITVIGAGETGQNNLTSAEPAQNSIGEIAPYAFFLLMIGGLVGGRFWLSRKNQ